MIHGKETNGNLETLTIDHLKEPIFNGQSEGKTAIDVLDRIAKDKGELLEQLRNSPILLERFGGSKRRLRKALDVLIEQSKDRIRHIAASSEFQNRIEKKRGWGGWALQKLKSAALFPIRHPLVTGGGALALVIALIYFFGPQAIGLGGVAKAAQEVFKDKVLQKIGVPTPATVMEAARKLPVTGGLANPAISTAESAGELMIDNLGTIQKAAIPAETVRAIQDTARSILSDPTIADPQKAFMNLLDK